MQIDWAIMHFKHSHSQLISLLEDKDFKDNAKRQNSPIRSFHLSTLTTGKPLMGDHYNCASHNRYKPTKAYTTHIPSSYRYRQWASCQIRKITGAHAPGMPGTFSPSPQVSDPDMHHGTCVTHVPWCMPESLTSGFLWNRRRGKTFPAFPAHAQPAILRIW